MIIKPYTIDKRVIGLTEFAGIHKTKTPDSNSKGVLIWAVGEDNINSLSPFGDEW